MSQSVESGQKVEEQNNNAVIDGVHRSKLEESVGVNEVCKEGEGVSGDNFAEADHAEADNRQSEAVEMKGELGLDTSMGKTTDGEADKAGGGGQTEDTNVDQKSGNGQEKIDSPKESPKSEKKLQEKSPQQRPATPDAHNEEEQDENNADIPAKTMSVEIKDKPFKQPDDINHFDSVSNIKSQPDKGRDNRRVSTVKQEKTDSSANAEKTNNNHQTPRLKKMKKGIFISYSPDAGFLERRFVVEAVRQLKENNLADDIWFDKDERNTDSPCWFSMRMEAVEKCRAAVVVLSDSYFSCPVSIYEGKTLVERTTSDPTTVKVFPVLFRQPDPADTPKHFQAFLESAIDLTGEHAKKSAAEKTSVVVGAIMEDLEKFATMHTAPLPATPPDSEFTGQFRRRKICQWSASDLQEWLFHLGIKEFYRQSLAEAMVDGFLLMSLTDHDMVTQLGIESRVVRKKMMQQILQTLDKEHKQPDNWHLRARALRPKPDVVYIIYDPADVRLAQNLKADLKSKSMQVIHHDTVKLGRSKEEFLQINGPSLATASHVIVVMTEAASGSPFIFHEVLFADWLGKKLVTAMFKNVWSSLRASLKAVLGDCPAVDFESQMYPESLDVLEHQIKPLRRVPGVVLEQTYLNKMAEGLKPLELLASSRGGAVSTVSQTDEDSPLVFISYQWDMQTKVDELQQILERAGFPCWADIAVGGATSANHASNSALATNNSASSGPRGHSSRSSRSSHHSLTYHQHQHASAMLTPGGTGNSGETLQGQIQRTMKACRVVVCCITPKYLQSDNCAKDLALADALHKPVIPLLLRYAPAESAPNYVRRILLRYSYVDLSNERLYKQNVGVLVDRVRKSVGAIELR